MPRPAPQYRKRDKQRQKTGTVVAAALLIALAGGLAMALLLTDYSARTASPAAGRAADNTAGFAPEVSRLISNAWAAGTRSANGSAAASPSTSAVTGADPETSHVTITIGWAGDTTPGSKYGQPPLRGKALFERVRSRLRKPDLMIVNLEGTLTTARASKCDGKDSKTCFAFKAPPANVSALSWAGIDLVNLANNHAYDYFEAGLQETKDALEGAGIAYTGLPGQVTVRKVKGVRVGVVGFSPYPWNAPLNDLATARELVTKAARQADVVVVVMHAGAEGADKIHTPSGPESAYGEQRGNVRRFAHAAIDAGADLVLGSGPHVVRGVERYKGRLIAYSLGDFAGWGNFGLGGNLSLSGLLTVAVNRRGDFIGGRWDSLRLVSPGVPTPDPTHASARLVRKVSGEDFEGTFIISRNGAISAP